jgi:predicted transposase YbfD/YdcC
MISAWATANSICLGQTVVDSKSNEITAFPKLLEILELSGILVTIDAMGCQTEIAQKIVRKEAGYCLAVKGNQPKLNQGIEEFFKTHSEDDFTQVKVRRDETREQEHGREDSRWYTICPLPKDLPDRERWPNLKAIGIAIHNSTQDVKDCNEVSYYILSKYLSGKIFGEAVRQHWAVEKNLHWQLDVTFNEDQSLIRKGHTDTNYSNLRRTALRMLMN